ncbi:MAG: SusD family outer membrane lipoprotein NanU, partial [Tannerellaceae bacterium]|nr:SusD family outer membrane lipoprotein NanU [Tannerellaceae bacterium]
MKKKSIIYSVISFIVIGFSGCNWLDVEPESSFTDDKYWQTEAHFNAFNVGLHSLIRDYSYNYFLLGEPRANLYNEVTPFGGEATQGVERLTYNTLNKENPGISNFADLYRPINQLSLMIDKTLATDLLPEIDRNYYLGQAYGLRAYLYFHLLRSWGDVVLHLHGTDGADLDFYNLSKAASPATEVLAQIKEDIKSSETAFGNDISFKQGRHYWSLPATLMLKGDVYLWSGKQMGGGASDYQTAKSALEKVQTADVALLDDFESVFAYTN